MGAPSHPWAKPITGQAVRAITVEGVETFVYPRGAIQRRQQVSFWVKAWQALGGQAANSSGALKYLLKQVEELAGNRDQQPVYIQWNATADPAALLNATELHDGWYVIESFEPNYERFVVGSLVQCRMTVSYVAPAAPRRFALAYTGAALSSNFSGAATNLLSVPVGATAPEASFTRTAAEGSISCILSPAASLEPVVLSTTLANNYKGGVHVYDTINTASNPVPTTGGTFVNANWVEVFGTDHDFTGDCVVTNGLQLLIFVKGASNLCTAYLWNTALAVTNWQQYATVNVQDDSLANGILQGYGLVRIGPEECALTTVSSITGTIRAEQTIIRLQRGRYEVRIDFRPITESNTNSQSIIMVCPAIPKVLYNSTKIADNVLSETSPTFATDYGYGAAFVANSAQPFILGYLYQNQPATQPFNSFGNSVNVGLGDSSGPAINNQRSYGFFAIPYGVSGTYSTANLQAEAETGTLGTGWTSVADAAASAGNTAQCASGTVAGNADLFGIAFTPAIGTYDVWFRIRVTDNTVSSAEMTVGIWNPTAGAFVAGQSTTLNRNAMTTTYSWVRVATGAGMPAANPTQFRAVTALTTTTAWFVDEACLVPKTLGADNRGPQDLYQQFRYDRGVRWVRP